MATFYTSRKLKTINAKNFRDSLAFSTPRRISYVYLARPTEFTTEFVPPEAIDNVREERSIWDNMIAAKQVLQSDIELVIPRYQWTANTRYKQYDDEKDLNFLLQTTTEGIDDVNPMFVVNSEGNVYKCICNNVGSFSMTEPTGTYTLNDGFIQTSDNHLWKYMYTVQNTNKFLTDNWIPVPYTEDSSFPNDYDVGLDNLVPGGLNKITMTNRGSGYVHSLVNVATFSAGTSTIQVTDDINLLTSNIRVDMNITGTGLQAGTYITNLNPLQNTIQLSTPTIATGGGSYFVTTRIDVDGDGEDVICEALLEGTQIRKINVLNIGAGYTRADIKIYGSGTGATARAILPPIQGHGYNPAKELGASSVMISVTIGDGDATEGGKFPTDISFRQYGILSTPYKYGDSVPVTEETAEILVSQTTDVTVSSGSEYVKNELVYQGQENSPTFSGYVITEDSGTIRLVDVFGTFTSGQLLIGKTSGRVRYGIDIRTPDLEPYTGDILYSKNILGVERTETQAEEIKLVLKF